MSTSNDKIRLSAEAGRLRKLYMTKKKARGCKVQSRSDNMRDWERAVELCRELGADFEDFIDAAFYYCTLSTGPFANGLGGKQAAEWWRQWTALKGIGHERIGESFSPAMRSLRQQVDFTRAVLLNIHGSPDVTPESMETILDSTMCLDPLACMIMAGHDKRVRDMYIDGARAMLEDSLSLSRAMDELGIDLENI